MIFDCSIECNSKIFGATVLILKEPAGNGILVLSLILFFNFDVKIFLIAFLAVNKLTENLLIIYFHLKSP